MSDLLSFILLLTLLISASCEAQQIVYFQASNTSILRDEKNGLHFANFVKHQFKYLEVTPLVTSLVPNRKKCQLWCVRNLQCLSLNVAIFPDPDGKFKCKLLATDIFNSSSNFIDNVNSNHYSLQTRCHDQPCHNGKCVPNYKTNAYSCQCQCPYYGYNCEKVVAQTWSPWTNCSFHHRCPDYTRRRLKMYALPEPPYANICPNNTVLDTEIQNCPTVQPTGCTGALGMQDGRIGDSQISASTYFNEKFSPRLARLHLTPTASHQACWVAAIKTLRQYLQIDLGTVRTITKVATQGRVSDPQYITKYSLAYSDTGIAWSDYPSTQCIKEFPGNFDQNTVVTNALDKPIKARYIRIVATAFYDAMALRCELYGC